MVPPTWRLREALAVMAERHATTALVASHGVLLGVLGEREVVRRLLEVRPIDRDLLVWEVMTAELDSLLESDTVGYAVRKLWTLGGRPIPILRADGAPFGLLETQDLVAWLFDQMGPPDARPQREGC